MADKRISQLNAHTSPTGSDLLVIVNNNETKKITYADLKDSIVINSDNTILNDFSASYLLDSASFHTRINAATNEQDLLAYVTDVVYEALSSSVDGRLDSLEGNSGSYETKGRGILSGSVSYTSLTNIPAGIVSSSTQVLGGSGVVSGSSQLTSSYDLRYAPSASYITSLNGTISSSSQIVEVLDSLNSYTSSLNNAIEITGSNVSFLGDIVVYGTQSIINSTNVEISDNILYLSPTASTNNDLGVVGHYNDGTYRHAGIFMDATDDHTWKVFKGLETETTGSYVDTSGTGFTLADFKAGVITGTSFNGEINATNGVISSSAQITEYGFATTGSNTFIDNQTILGYVTASSYLGNGRYLNNLPATTNWNYNQEFTIKKTEQLTFSGDYILENTYLEIQSDVTSSIGEWENRVSTHGGSISKTSNNTYLIEGPVASGGVSDGNLITKYFDTATTLSVAYVWNGTDIGDDWPFYDIQDGYPYEYGTTNMLQNINASSESGNWIINIPAESWVSFGVWTNSSNSTSGTLQITLPYIQNEDILQYSSNKYFKKEGSIFIGGNLLIKDSFIRNNGKISVGGEVILIGDSQIVGTGIII